MGGAGGGGGGRAGQCFENESEGRGGLLIILYLETTRQLIYNVFKKEKNGHS